MGMAGSEADDLAIRVRLQPESSTQEVLAGLVERVTFHNAENGFCVLRAKARGHRDLVTIVGHAPTISAREWITATGEWVNDRTHGQQRGAPDGGGAGSSAGQLPEETRRRGLGCQSVVCYRPTSSANSEACERA